MADGIRHGGAWTLFCRNGEHIWGKESKFMTITTHKRWLLAPDEVISDLPEEAQEPGYGSPLLWEPVQETELFELASF